MIKKTERGWAGHFICANRCRFRRNTLLEKGNIRIVVSSVGLMENWTGDPRQDKNIRGFETVGPNRYYETMAFHAEPAPSRYFDADVSREVHFAAPWYIKEVDADDKANAQHDAVVEEIATRMAAGEFDNLNDSITGGGTPYRESTGSALALAKRFHDTYERLAPSFGYETRPETRQFDADSPNGRLMVAVCAEIIEQNNGMSLERPQGANSAPCTGSAGGGS